MTRAKTAEESRNEYVKIMGEPLGGQYAALWQQLASVNAKWGEYVELYGTKESRIDLLNQAAPYFFRVVQDSLWEDILLHIARLTEPSKVKGKAVLTVQTLPDLVDTAIKQSVSRLVTTAKQKAAFCLDWRHRHIAHRDLALALEVEKKPLDPANRRGVREALAAIAGVLNEVSRHYMDSETAFDHPVSPDGAEQLLYVIYDGVQAAAAREERIKRGEFLRPDHAALDL